jgi:hypothetical protein
MIDQTKRDVALKVLRAEYAPYDTMPEFEVGFYAYRCGIYDLGWENVAAQAFDRGLECASRFDRT